MSTIKKLIIPLGKTGSTLEVIYIVSPWLVSNIGRKRRKLRYHRFCLQSRDQCEFAQSPQRRLSHRKIYTTEFEYVWAPPASCLTSSKSPKISLPLDNNAVVTLVARSTVPLAGWGAGATGALCAGNEGVFGSSNAKMMAEKQVTRNWGMTMNML